MSYDPAAAGLCAPALIKECPKCALKGAFDPADSEGQCRKCGHVFALPSPRSVEAVTAFAKEYAVMSARKSRHLAMFFGALAALGAAFAAIHFQWPVPGGILAGLFGSAFVLMAVDQVVSNCPVCGRYIGPVGGWGSPTAGSLRRTRLPGCRFERAGDFV